MLELRVRVNAAQYGLSKSETMREVAKEFLILYGFSRTDGPRSQHRCAEAVRILHHLH